jgi:hypothetical protein
VVSPLSYDPFHPPGATHVYTFIPDHPAYRPEQRKSPPGSAAPAAPAASQVLLPVRAAQPPVVTSSRGPAFTPPGARPERLQSFG